MNVNERINNAICDAVIDKLDIESIAKDIAKKMTKDIKAQCKSSEFLDEFDFRSWFWDALNKGEISKAFDKKLDDIVMEMVKAIPSEKQA
jgi:hypothetical protein